MVLLIYRMDADYLVALKYQAIDKSVFLPSYSTEWVKFFFAPEGTDNTKNNQELSESVEKLPVKANCPDWVICGHFW